MRSHFFIFSFFLFTFLFTLSCALRPSLLLVLFVTCRCRSRALRPLLLTLSFIFFPPLCFPFSLNLNFVGLGCGQDAMLGVVGLQWFFMDRGSLRWFVVGLCGGLVSGFCDLISVSFNFSGFDWFWWVLDFGGWVRGLIGVALGAGCGLIGVV